VDFIFGGNATFTLTSAKTGQHFTFKASRKKGDDQSPIFIKVLTGPDNSWNGDWLFLGFIPKDGTEIIAGRKGHPEAPSFQALSWTLRHLHQDNIPADVTIQHEGTCGRCNRKLTHPESVASGIGPECAKKG
jgi:hypothetical protein